MALHRIDVGIDDEDPVAGGMLDGNVVGSAKSGIVTEDDDSDHHVVEFGHLLGETQHQARHLPANCRRRSIRRSRRSST